MTKDLLGQEVNIGDWVAALPKGYKSVIIAKVTSFTKSGNPRIKTNVNAREQNVGLTLDGSWKINPITKKSDWVQETVAHFTKIMPTVLIDRSYEV